MDKKFLLIFGLCIIADVLLSIWTGLHTYFSLGFGGGYLLSKFLNWRKAKNE